MKRDRFTRQEAERKIGKVIRTSVDFSGVPKGTTGKVIKIDDTGDFERERESWGVAVQLLKF